MSYPRPIGRAEARAQTRELVLDAAEELFLAQGFHSTTVAQIAAKAGRTQGSLYGNFAGKEALCLEVIQRRQMQVYLPQLAALLGTPNTTNDGIAAVFTEWFARLAADEALTILILECLLAARHDPKLRDAVATYFNIIRTTIRTLIAARTRIRTSEMDELIESATLGLVSTSVGLAFEQAVDVIASDQASHVMAETLRAWLDQLSSEETIPSHTSDRSGPPGEALEA